MSMRTPPRNRWNAAETTRNAYGVTPVVQDDEEFDALIQAREIEQDQAAAEWKMNRDV